MERDEIDKLVLIVQNINYGYCDCLVDLLDGLQAQFPEHDWRDLCYKSCKDCGKKLESVIKHLCTECYVKRYPAAATNAMTLKKMDTIFRDTYTKTIKEAFLTEDYLVRSIKGR